MKDCEYGQAEDDIVRDRIVFGTKSAKVREKLIDIGSDLTLERVIELARVDEVSVQKLYMSWLCHHAEGHPIAYASRALTKTQQNYAQTEIATGSRVRVRKVPSVCVRSNCSGRNGPQTPAVSLQQTTTSSASETPTLSAATTEVGPTSQESICTLLTL